MKKFVATLAPFLMVLWSSMAFSYTVTPIIQNFSIEGKESTQTFLIDNSSDRPVSVEFEVTTREILEDGSEKRLETSDFTVYPLQMTIKAQSKRNIRVSYIGKKDITSEIPYRLIVRQLPISAQKDKSGVNFMFEYIASIYVSPKGLAAGEVELRPVGELKAKDKMALKIRIENKSKKHFLTENLVFKLVDGKKEYIVQKNDWLTGPLPNYLPGTSSTISVLLPAGMVGRTARLSYENKVNP